MEKIIRKWRVKISIFNHSSKYATYSSDYNNNPTEKDILETYSNSTKAFPVGSREITIEEFYIVEGFKPDTSHMINVTVKK
jgi:hypothetical protein